MLQNKTIVLGVTGSIAAYKAAELASQLTQAGAKVNVVMTKEALHFVSAVTFRAVTGRPVVTEMFDLASEFSIEHVSLAKAADIVVIAPATANVIAKLAAGIADDMLGCTVLATKAPVVIAPAMETNMYANPVTQDNLAKLKVRKFVIVEPATGWLASGKVGLGRLADVGDIIGTIRRVLGGVGDLAGKHIVVTAGGTQEPIDPVRYIGNRSSGKMGYALAEAARDRGATVTLITAPVSLPQPTGVEIACVNTAEEMRQAVERATSKADALIMAAAVADYRPIKAAKDKIKKGKAGLTLQLECTPDILGTVKGDFVKVGFAAESSNLVENAREKLKQKGLDFIVANDITASDSGFGSDTNRVTIIDRKGKVENLPLMSKREVADKILDRVADLLSSRVSGDAASFAEITVTRSVIKHNSNIRIYKKYRHMFPDSSSEIELTDGRETVKRRFNQKNREFALRGWVRKYKVEEGDIIKITPILAKQKYRVNFIRKS